MSDQAAHDYARVNARVYKPREPCYGRVAVPAAQAGALAHALAEELL